MKQFTLVLIIGVVVVLTICKAQEVSIFQDRGQGQPPPSNAGGDGDIQDESELASALGIDRQALYEDLMRIQEELGGSPPVEQNSQEEAEDY